LNGSENTFLLQRLANHLWIKTYLKKKKHLKKKKILKKKKTSKDKWKLVGPAFEPAARNNKNVLGQKQKKREKRKEKKTKQKKREKEKKRFGLNRHCK
jgi:hypothetical protein